MNKVEAFAIGRFIQYQEEKGFRGWRRFGFRKALAKTLLFSFPNDADVIDCLPRMVPDVYRIIVDENMMLKHVICVEVEDTSKMTDAKFYRYSRLVCCLDSIAFDPSEVLSLVITDRYGTVNTSISGGELWWKEPVRLKQEADKNRIASGRHKKFEPPTLMEALEALG